MHLFRASFRHSLGSGNELAPKVLSGHAQVTWRVLAGFSEPVRHNGFGGFCAVGLSLLNKE